MTGNLLRGWTKGGHVHPSTTENNILQNLLELKPLVKSEKCQSRVTRRNGSSAGVSTLSTCPPYSEVGVQ